ncbi:Gonadotropin-releasing hormone II receptor [Folsomia candida]|uniref:Gonadotropin-releasing hormone II receptor n=1 Tax=Folsomia candida TaxID=158441 RepID=A0A226D8U5_FOLCA|nr:Gonadotropin-releasing hormone II receptor [Folsomia candida]
MPHFKYSAIVGTSVFQDGGEPFRNYRGFELPDNTTTLFPEPASFHELNEHRSVTPSQQDEDQYTTKIHGNFPITSIIPDVDAIQPEIVSGNPIFPGEMPHGLQLDPTRLFVIDLVSPSESERGRSPPFLRRNQAGGRLLARARVKTLRTTFIILATFLLCWTPYVVMTLW